MFRLANGWYIGCAVVLLLASCRFDRTGLEPGDVGSPADVSTDMRPDAQIYDLGPDLLSGLDLSLVKPPDGALGDGLGPSYTPANIAPTWWAYGTGNLTVSAGLTLTIDTSKNLATPQLPPGVGLYNDATGNYTILTLHDLKVELTGTLRGTGTRPLIIVAGGSVTIDGLVDISTTGKNPGPGGQYGGGRAKAGSGCGGGNQGELKVLGYDSGGAGASFGGKGGRGGDGPLAKVVDQCNQGCSKYCVTHCLTPLRGGSGGGGGGDLVGGEGGAGGGALQISARDVITVGIKGVINAAGGTGGGGSGAGGSGAGGGSGGGILLEAPTVTLSGTVAANGGGGGGGGAAWTVGQSGANGQPSGAAASGGAGAFELFGASIGGKGGAGSATGDGAENASDGNIGSGLEYGQGGGGGGSGRICIRNKSGTVGGTISPRSTNLLSVPYTLLAL